MLRKRRLLAICLAVAMTFSLAGCAKEEPKEEVPTVTTEQPTVEETPVTPVVEEKTEPEIPSKPAVDAVDGAITFEDEKFGFIKLDSSPGNADLSELSIVDSLGSKALKVTIKDGKVPYIAIDASSLLKDKVTELRKMELSVLLEYPSGEFYACSGNIVAYSGADRIKSEDKWSVYLAHKNPNKAVAELDLKKSEQFVVGAQNFFVLTKETDNGITAGVEPSNLIIDNIVFYDENGNVLAADSSAGFDAPAGFGAADVTNLTPVGNEHVMEGVIGSTSGGWGQAVSIETIKNDGGTIDPALFVPGSIVTVYYQSASAPELIFQSWTEGAPETAGWAKVAPTSTNDSITTSQFSYADIVAAFGTDDLATYLDKFNVGDTGEALSVTKVTVGIPAPDVFGWADLSNLDINLVNSVVIEGATGRSTGWGQAVSLATLKNDDGVIDSALFAPGSIVTVFYQSATAPELILQSWTEGAPETAGWAKISPFTTNDSNNVCQFKYDDMVAAFGSDDFATLLDKFNVGDTGNDLEVVKVVVSQAGDAAAVPTSIVVASEAPVEESKTEETPAEDKPAPSFTFEGTVIDGATGKSSGAWKEAVKLITTKNDGGTFDTAILKPGLNVIVYFTADTAPEIVCQSWTDGAPVGWAKVAASSVNADNNIATYTYEDMVASFGTDDFAGFLDAFLVGDTGSPLEVFGVSYK